MHVQYYELSCCLTSWIPESVASSIQAPCGTDPGHLRPETATEAVKREASLDNAATTALLRIFLRTDTHLLAENLGCAYRAFAQVCSGMAAASMLLSESRMVQHRCSGPSPKHPRHPVSNTCTEVQTEGRDGSGSGGGSVA